MIRTELRTLLSLAVAEHVSAETANRLVDAWPALDAAGVGGDQDAAMGAAVAVSASTLDAPVAHAQLQALPLTSVTLGDELTIGPADARRHPLVMGWASENLPQAIGLAILSGRLGFGLSRSAPGYRVFELVERDGVILSARARLQFEGTFGAVDVTLTYGPDVHALSFGRVTVLDGDAVFALGVAMREAAPEADVVAIDSAERSQHLH